MLFVINITVKKTIKYEIVMHNEDRTCLMRTEEFKSQLMPQIAEYIWELEEDIHQEYGRENNVAWACDEKMIEFLIKRELDILLQKKRG